MHIGSDTHLASGIKQNMVLIILVALYWGLAFLAPWDWFDVSSETTRIVLGLILLAFVLVHGVRRYGWNAMLLWFGITFFISWAAETLSIALGFPFGGYYYTEILGVKAGQVPLAIMPAYFLTSYLAWTIGTIFLRNLGRGIEKRNLFLLPFIAGFIMVMWDFCFDPIRSTIDGLWIWEEGGAYHGVPVSNFFGWYMTVFLIYQVFALYLYRFGSNEGMGQSKLYWYLVPVMYLGLALEFLVYPFSESTNREIYWSIFLAAIFTMVFVSILGMLFVRRTDEGSFGARPLGERDG